MALIAIASDKGAPGVTTAALALAAVWPRPVLLAECDPAGGDLVYRFPAADGGRLDPRRGVLSLAVIARRGMAPHQVWEHVQKLHGGLDVLAGVTNAEQGAGLSLLWGPIGKVLASLPQADVIADCGRLGADGPLYDLLAEATKVVLVTKVHVADVIRLRDRAAAFAAAAQSRGRRGFGVGVVVIADHKRFRAAIGEVQQVLGQGGAPATVLGGIAHDTKGADLLSGEWGGNLDRTLLIKTAREVAQPLLYGLPPIGTPPAQPVPRPNPQVPAAPYGTPETLSTASTYPPSPVQVTAAPAYSAPPSSAPPSHAAEGSSAASGSRSMFSRARGGRSGKHQADPGQGARAASPSDRTPPSPPAPQPSHTSTQTEPASPEQLPPEQLPSVRQTPVPQTPVPQTPVPQTPVPQTPVPQPVVPHTVVPQPVVPQTAASTYAPSRPGPPPPAPTSAPSFTLPSPATLRPTDIRWPTPSAPPAEPQDHAEGQAAPQARTYTRPPMRPLPPQNQNQYHQYQDPQNQNQNQNQNQDRPDPQDRG